MKSSSSLRIAVICGPTGVGKTNVSIEAASALNAEIISADSMQVYRYMDIGTAKPSAWEQSQVPHHMINIVNPDEPFDAQQYAEKSQKIISRLAEENIPVIVAGGTGLYIRALIYGMFQTGSSDLALRMKLKEEAENNGTETLYQRLCVIDPISAKKIHPNDAFRIIRAIEIFENTGHPISEWHQKHRQFPPKFDVLIIGLSRQRELLYDRIDHRVDMMVDEGLADEVESLLEKGYSPKLKSLQSIGYRHMVDFFEGRQNWVDSLRILKRDSRRYAKRQMTWFNANPQVQWIDAERTDEIIFTIKSFMFS